MNVFVDSAILREVHQFQHIRYSSPVTVPQCMSRLMLLVLFFQPFNSNGYLMVILGILLYINLIKVVEVYL